MAEKNDPNIENTATRETAAKLRPAFASTRQALCFVALLVSILLLPEMIAWSGLIERRHSYEIMTENHGAYSFVANEVFENKEDIDLLFLGSSILFSGVDTVQVQEALSRELGRPARVVTFGHYFNSVDVSYMQLRDVLERKRVRMVVLSIPRMPYTDGPSTTGCRFVRHSEVDEIFSELPLKYKAALYACGVLRAPRDLLSIVRRNGSSISPSSFSENLGSDRAEIGIGREARTFVKFNPTSPSVPTESMILSSRTNDIFQFTNEEIPFYQNLYLDKLVGACRRNRVPLAMLNIPQYTERHNEQVIERQDWRERFGAEVQIIGVSPAVLFAGLNEEEVDRLRFDDSHFNANGSEFFTRTVLPAILEVHKEHAAKDD